MSNEQLSDSALAQITKTLAAEQLALIAKEIADKLAQDIETKRLFKEALSEWLDHKYSDFGRWSLMGLLAAGFAAMIVFIFWTQGYHR